MRVLNSDEMTKLLCWKKWHTFNSQLRVVGSHSYEKHVKMTIQLHKRGIYYRRSSEIILYEHE